MKEISKGVQDLEQAGKKLGADDAAERQAAYNITYHLLEEGKIANV
jgi:hypothetical protein